jgi:hypothetical protein
MRDPRRGVERKFTARNEGVRSNFGRWWLTMSHLEKSVTHG